MRKQIKSLFCKKSFFALVLSLCFLPSLASAVSENVPRIVTQGRQENAKGDFVDAGERVEMEGAVAGDVMVAGRDVNFAGRVGGDYLGAGVNVGIKGEIGQNLRVAGANVTISGKIGKNLTVTGMNLRVEEGAEVAGNAYLIGGTTAVKGLYKGNVTVMANEVVFGARVQGNVDIFADGITLLEGTDITGSLTYHSNQAVEILSGAKIAGGVVKKPPLAAMSPENRGDSYPSLVLGNLWKLLAGLVVLLAFWRVFGMHLDLLCAQHAENFWPKLGWGLMGLSIVPITVFILILTLVGIPLAIIIMAFYAVAIYISSVLAVLLFGKWLVALMKITERASAFPWLSFFLGAIIVAVIGYVPFFGFVARMILVLWAFGSLIRYTKNLLAAPAQSD
ncbi:MAG: hypothetical protein Q8N81_01650 [bacterium]|nr:hypothetical protein [bacterium]